MSVSTAQRVVAGVRAHRCDICNGIAVKESDGAYSRGNGQTSNYMGISIHHTAGNFGHDYPTLYNGRPDLPGPLCNTSGNEDGSITLIAAHPGNHAGASGGWDTAPLPVTSLFNKLMWGHEICYPGTVPMRTAQYHSACVLAKVVCDVLGRDSRYIKMHNGTSITGKWDAGYAMGKTYNIAEFRNNAWNTGTLSPPPEDEEEDMNVVGMSVADDPGQKDILLVGASRIPRGITKDSQAGLNKHGVKNALMGKADYLSLKQEAIDERYLLDRQIAAARAEDAEV